MTRDRYDDHDMEEYQDELSEQVDDGSGCTETWKELNNFRSNDANRRKVLKYAVSALGFSLSSIPTMAKTVSAQARDEPKTDVLKVTDANERRKTVARANSSEKVHKLMTFLSKKGLNRNRNNVLVIHSTYGDRD